MFGKNTKYLEKYVFIDKGHLYKVGQLPQEVDV